MTKRSKGVLASALLAGAAVSVAVWLAGEAWRPSLPVPREAVFPAGAQWITVDDGVQHTGCFRKDFVLHGEVAHAWVMIAAEGGFELTCNGNPVGAFTSWRPTRPFQNGLTAGGQRAVASDPAMALNFPRGYQWTGHANHRVPVFFDLRPHLRRGDNVLCVETEARRPRAAIRLGGQAILADGREVPLVSNATW
ncbi:MAG: hypothetical protein HKO57_15825, partial [Akkermansiaceae bacterium]|nr:hypothetical protein [Akkermansiaceae bacterium]